MNQEKNHHNLLLSGKVNYLKEEGVESDPIGEFNIIMYDQAWYSDIRYAADEHSEHRLEAMTQVSFGTSRMDAGKYVQGRIAILNRFTIYEEYQRKGFGTRFMEELIDYLHNVLYVNYIVLQASPFMEHWPYPDEENVELTDEQHLENSKYVEMKREQLSDFYKNVGFEHTGKDSLNYMVLSIGEYMSNKEKLFLTHPIAEALKLNQDDINFWEELFGVMFEMSGDAVQLADCDDHLAIARYYYAKEVLESIKDKKIIKVTPMMVHYVGGQLIQEKDLHQDMECSESSSCPNCKTIKKCEELIVRLESEMPLADSYEKIDIEHKILKYIELLPSEIREEMYRKAMNEVEETRLKMTS